MIESTKRVVRASQHTTLELSLEEQFEVPCTWKGEAGPKMRVHEVRFKGSGWGSIEVVGRRVLKSGQLSSAPPIHRHMPAKNLPSPIYDAYVRHVERDRELDQIAKWIEEGGDVPEGS